MLMEEYILILCPIKCSFQAENNANIYTSKAFGILKVVNGHLNASAAAKPAKKNIKHKKCLSSNL